MNNHRNAPPTRGYSDTQRDVFRNYTEGENECFRPILNCKSK
jgi:hypothetical protein